MAIVHITKDDGLSVMHECVRSPPNVLVVLPFSHLLLCLEPSLPLRNASRRSILSRRTSLRLVVILAMLSSGTESVTDVPRTTLFGVVGVALITLA